MAALAFLDNPLAACREPKGRLGEARAAFCIYGHSVARTIVYIDGFNLYDLPPEKWTPGYAYFASACCGVM